MSSVRRFGNVWIRWIHESWTNLEGWRTDIPQSVLDDSSLTIALFILDDKSVVFVPMNEMRTALKDAPRHARHRGRVVGPYNLNHHTEMINGIKVKNMRVYRPKDSEVIVDLQD